MSDVFISYAREDRETAQALAHALERAGLSVWWDRVIPPGRTFDEVIAEQLAAARCVVVLWSRAAVASGWVKEEAAEALQRQVLVPALIEDVAIPLGFRRLQAADLKGWRGGATSDGLDLLLAAVRETLGRTAPTDAGAVAPAPAGERGEQQGPPAWRWCVAAVAVFLLGSFHVFAASNTTGNPDPVVIASIVGVPAALFLMTRRRGYRFLWLLAPIATYVIGMPFGSSHGTMRTSPIFGLWYGDETQPRLESTLVLAAILAIAVVTDRLWFVLSSRGRR